MAGTVTSDCPKFEIASMQAGDARTEMVISYRLADVELVDPQAVYFVSLHRQRPKPRHSATIRNPTRNDWFDVLLQP